MIRGTSEGSETSKLEYSATQIQICRVYVCLGNILEVILKKRRKMTFTKIDSVDFDSPHRKLSNSGLKSAVTLLVHWQINFFVGSYWKSDPAVTKINPKIARSLRQGIRQLSDRQAAILFLLNDPE